jgi:hypothetical protein
MRSLRFLPTARLLIYGLFVAAYPLPAYCLDVQSPPDLLRAELEHKVEFLRPLLDNTLTPSELQMFDRIRTVISSDEAIASPLADTDASGPYITFTYGLGRLVNAVVDAIYSLPSKQSIQYIGYVVAEQKKTVHVTNGSHTAPAIKPFYEWANWSPDQIAQYRSNQQLQRNAELTSVGVLGFIYAHEVAHLLLGHVTNPAPDLQTKRDRELAADAWASEHLIRADVGPLVGVFAMVYFAALDCNALAREKDLTHPADIRRISAVISQTEAGLDRLQIKPGGLSRDEVRAMLQNLSNFLQTEIANGNGCITSAGWTSPIMTPPDGAFCFHLNPDNSGLFCSVSMVACEKDRQSTINDPDFANDHPTSCQLVTRMYCGSRRRTATSGESTFCHPTLDDCIAEDSRRARRGAIQVFECHPFGAPAP